MHLVGSFLDILFLFPLPVLYDFQAALHPAPFETLNTTSRQRLKGSHYQHVNMMSPFPQHSSNANNRVQTQA